MSFPILYPKSVREFCLFYGSKLLAKKPDMSDIHLQKTIQAIAKATWRKQEIVEVIKESSSLKREEYKEYQDTVVAKNLQDQIAYIAKMKTTRLPEFKVERIEVEKPKVERKKKNVAIR